MRFGLGIVGQFPPLDRSLSPVPGIDLELSSEVDVPLSFELRITF